jgi:hypothetical protein
LFNNKNIYVYINNLMKRKKDKKDKIALWTEQIPNLSRTFSHFSISPFPLVCLSFFPSLPVLVGGPYTT